MNKLMMVAAASAAFALAAVADENVKAEAAAANAKSEAAAPAEGEDLQEEEDTPVFEAGFDNDLMTAYVWRNTVVNDRAVWQPCIWADLTYFEPFWVGFYVWQNWDFTRRREADGYPRAMNETDYNIHLGATVWSTDTCGLDLEVGHEWFTYRHLEGYSNPSSNEIYAKMKFSNPIVNFYAQYSQAYHPVTACHFEGGFERTFELTDTLSCGADWNMNFGSGKYLTEYLYGVGGGELLYDEEEDEEYFENDYLGNGIAGTTVKGNLTWSPCDHLSLGLVLAYTAVLNSEARDNMHDSGYCHTYSHGMVWGGFQVKLSF